MQQQSSYIVVVSFIGGWNWSTRRNPPSHWQTVSHNVVPSTPRMSGIGTHCELVVIFIDCINSCKSNYHAITTTTAPKGNYEKNNLGNNTGKYLWIRIQEMKVSKHQSGVIPNSGKDSIDSICSVCYCNPKSDTDKGNFIVFSIYEIDVWPLIKEIHVINWWYLVIIYITLIW